MSDGRASRGHPLAVLRVPAFARLFSAGVASAAGQGIGNIALVWLVFTATGSALDVAALGVATLLGTLALTLFAGALADRQDRRRLMIVADAARAGALAVLVVALELFGFALVLVLGAALVMGAFSTLFQPAERALTPAVVGEHSLADANSLVTTSYGAIQFVSSAAGGVMVVALGAVVSLGVNAATFLVSGALIAGIALPRAITFPRSAHAAAPPRSLLSEVADGYRYLVSSRGLLYVTLSAGLENFFASMAIPFLVVYTSVDLHGSAVDFGALVGLLGLGWGPGSFLVGRFGAIRRAGLVWGLCGIAEGSLLALFVIVPVLPVVLVVALGIGVLLGFSNTTWLTAVQLIVPTEMQGRYFGFDQLGSWAVIPLGDIAGGLGIVALGVPWTFAIASVGFAGSAALFLATPSLRGWGYPLHDGANAAGPVPLTPR